MIELTGYAFACAVIGFVYSDVLTEPDMLLHGTYKWIEKTLHNKCKSKMFEDQWEYKWIFKPVIACFRCVTGQIALWTFLVMFANYRGVAEEISLQSAKLLFEQLFHHIYFITISIYFSWMLSKLYRVNL